MKIYVTGYVNEDSSIRTILERCFTSLEDARKSFRPEANEDWVKIDPNLWVDRGGWPRAAVIEVELGKPSEIAEGFLWRDFDDGWILGGEGPRNGNRICDLFPAHDGKRVRVTIEVLP